MKRMGMLVTHRSDAPPTEKLRQWSDLLILDRDARVLDRI